MIPSEPITQLLPPLPIISNPTETNPVLLFSLFLLTVRPYILSEYLNGEVRQSTLSHLGRAFISISFFLNPTSQCFRLSENPFSTPAPSQFSSATSNNTCSSILFYPLPQIVSESFKLNDFLVLLRTLIMSVITRKQNLRAITEDPTLNQYPIQQSGITNTTDDEKEDDETGIKEQQYLSDWDTEADTLGSLTAFFTTLFTTYRTTFVVPFQREFSDIIFDMLQPPPETNRKQSVPTSSISSTPFFSNLAQQNGNNIKARIPTYLPDDSDRSFALFLLNDCVENADTMASEIVPSFMPFYLYFADISHSCVLEEPLNRQNAAAGIGYCAQYGGSSFSPFCSEALRVLVGIIQMKIDSDNETDLMAFDNAVSALLRIVTYQAGSFPHGEDDKRQALRIIYRSLPLTHDNIEAKICHTELARLISTNDSVLFDNDAQVAIRAANMLNTKQLDQTDEKVGKGFTRLFSILLSIICSEDLADEKSISVFLHTLRILTQILPANILTGYYNNLSESEKKKVTTLLQDTS